MRKAEEEPQVPFLDYVEEGRSAMNLIFLEKTCQIRPGVDNLC